MLRNQQRDDDERLEILRELKRALTGVLDIASTKDHVKVSTFFRVPSFNLPFKYIQCGN